MTAHLSAEWHRSKWMPADEMRKTTQPEGSQTFGSVNHVLPPRRHGPDGAKIMHHARLLMGCSAQRTMLFLSAALEDYRSLWLLFLFSAWRGLLSRWCPSNTSSSVRRCKLSFVASCVSSRFKNHTLTSNSASCVTQALVRSLNRQPWLCGLIRFWTHLPAYLIETQFANVFSTLHPSSRFFFSIYISRYCLSRACAVKKNKTRTLKNLIFPKADSCWRGSRGESFEVRSVTPHIKSSFHHPTSSWNGDRLPSPPRAAFRFLTLFLSLWLSVLFLYFGRFFQTSNIDHPFCIDQCFGT